MENITVTHSFKENGHVLRLGYINQIMFATFSEQDYSGPQDQTTWFEIDNDSSNHIANKVNSFDQRRPAMVELLEGVIL